MSQKILDCCSPSQCGGKLPVDLDPRGELVSQIPYLCPACYRMGWRAEGLLCYPGGPRVYQLPWDKTPTPLDKENIERMELRCKALLGPSDGR